MTEPYAEDDLEPHQTIWLQPWCKGCQKHSYEGRQWCQDEVWGACDECGRKAEKYTLAITPADRGGNDA